MAHNSRLIRHLALRLVLSLGLALTVLGVALPQQVAQANNDIPLILLHGLEGYSSANCYTSSAFTPSNAYSRWSGFWQVNTSNTNPWDSPDIHALKYYNGDVGCEDMGTDPRCNGYYESNTDANVGTNNEDIRHLACRFYWYIYNNYTKQGIAVNILAHSLGGIIANYALALAGWSPTFPYTLLIYNVVALSSPIRGAPNPFNQTADTLCNNCFEAHQIAQGDPQSIMSQFESFAPAEGFWTLIGSSGVDHPGALIPCDEASYANGTVDPNASLVQAQVITYDQCIYHEEITPGAKGPGSVSYQDDTSLALNDSAWVGPWGHQQHQTGLPHPLEEAFQALSVDRGPRSYLVTVAQPNGWVGVTYDGLLQPFVVALGQIYDRRQQCVTNGCWVGWSIEGHTSPALFGTPVIARSVDGRQEVFASGRNGTLYTSWENCAGLCGWSSWVAMVNGVVGNPAVVLSRAGQMEVFVVRSDGNLWSAWQTCAGCGWSSWVSFGGSQSGTPVVGTPTVVLSADGRFQGFIRLSDGRLETAWQTCAGCGWSGWTTYTTGVRDDPTLTLNSDGRQEAFVEGHDGTLWSAWQVCVGCGWSAWSSLGGPQMVGKPAVVQSPNGRLEVFVRGTDQGLWTAWQTSPGSSSWSSWVRLATNIAGDPGANLDGDGRMEAFAMGTDGALWDVSQVCVSCSWSSQTSLGVPG